MNLKDLSSEQQQAIISAYRGGTSEDRIGEGMGLSRDTVRRLLIRHGVEKRGRGRGLKLNSEQEESVFTRYMAGEGRYPLADEFGVHESTIRRVLKVRSVRPRREAPTGLALERIPDVAPVYEPSVEGKVCTKCKMYKLAAEFYTLPSKPMGIQSMCKECAKERAREQWFADVEKSRERMRGRYAGDIERWRAYGRVKQREYYAAGIAVESRRRWRLNNPEACRRYGRQSYARHREQRLAAVLDWQRRTRPARNAYRRTWSKTPKGRHSAAVHSHRRRELVRRVQAECRAPLTLAEWQEIIEQQGGECASCCREFSANLPPTRDHIVPVTKGGMLTKENVQALCRSCNTKKGTKIIDYRKAK